eukprot:TRINITY_DN119_c0_g1_i1.p1 TRINITY_DN119_c0_g1~~TRINITY_DN119_c0_g1_i1.p1  ORF type:complete len:280 (+),score=58.77 TRINITY_DN119_c0_g1_i1:119-958(+)
MCIRDRYQRRVRGVARSNMSGVNFQLIIDQLASRQLSVATNACGILCSITLGSQRARSAVSSAPDIIEHVTKALGGKGDLPHNAALLVSILSTVASFRLAFVKSKGLKLLVNLLNKSEDSGEQTNIMYALTELAGAGKDCHTELYDTLVSSGVTWKARQLMCSGDENLESNAHDLAQKLRVMPVSGLALERMGSSDAVHALALLGCDNRTSAANRVTPNRRTKPMNQWSPSQHSKKRRLEHPTVDRSSRRARLEESQSDQARSQGVGLSALASVIHAVR